MLRVARGPEGGREGMARYFALTLENAEGDVLETEYLVWSEDSNRVWTNRPVTIRTADGVIYGEGLESDARFETYRIIKPRGEMVLEGTELR